MEEQLALGKTVSFGPKGTSMLPLIRQNIDTIVLKSPPDRLKKYDLPLYRRENGQFVLHRVVGFDKDGYMTCGDNQNIYEHGVKQSQIIAIAVGMNRGDEYVSFDNKEYIRYCHRRVSMQSRIRLCRKFKVGMVKLMKTVHIHQLFKKMKNFVKRC